MQPLVERRRAARYEMSAPVTYRRVGEDEWHEGRTVNVSGSGVLIDGPVPALSPGTSVEFVLVLESPGSRSGSRVRCRGAVVRHERRGRQDGRAMAATIDAYDFMAPHTAAGRVDG